MFQLFHSEVRSDIQAGKHGLSQRFGVGFLIYNLNR